MKTTKIAIFSLSVFALIPNLVNADTEISSTITDVTIYTEGATVTRTAVLQLAAGENQITFSGLPNNLNVQGLRVEVANSKVNLGQVSIRNLQSRDIKDQEIAKLKVDIESLKQKILTQEDGIKTAKLQLKFLESLAIGFAKDAWVNTAQASADVRSWQQALGIMQSGSDAAYKKIRVSEQNTSELNKDKSVLQRTLLNLTGGERASTTLIVHLAAATGLSTKVSLHYFQEDAGWAPTYEARLDSDGGQLVLSQKAKIYQQTGEHWKSVKVTLSTSKPSEELLAPQIGSVLLDLEAEYNAYSRDEFPTLSTSKRAAPLEEIIVTASKRAKSWSGAYALSYPIAGRIDIASNTEEIQSYDLEKHSFDATLVTQIVPQASNAAFLTARIVHTGKLPLYGNSLVVYVDGVLMGIGEMPTLQPGAEIDLPMGQDHRIEVSVADQGGEGGASGIVKRRKIEVTDLVFEIVNRRSVATIVEVKDAYPVSRNKAIKVEVAKSATKPDEENVDDQVGVVLWRNTLEPGETWKINQNYTISYPANRQLETN